MSYQRRHYKKPLPALPPGPPPLDPPPWPPQQMHQSPQPQARQYNRPPPYQPNQSHSPQPQIKTKDVAYRPDSRLQQSSTSSTPREEYNGIHNYGSRRKKFQTSSDELHSAHQRWQPHTPPPPQSSTDRRSQGSSHGSNATHHSVTPSPQPQPHPHHHSQQSPHHIANSSHPVGGSDIPPPPPSPPPSATTSTPPRVSVEFPPPPPIYRPHSSPIPYPTVIVKVEHHSKPNIYRNTAASASVKTDKKSGTGRGFLIKGVRRKGSGHNPAYPRSTQQKAAPMVTVTNPSGVTSSLPSAMYQKPNQTYPNHTTKPENDKYSESAYQPQTNNSDEKSESSSFATSTNSNSNNASSKTKWIRGECIGVGAFGKVFKGFSRANNTIVAIKEMPLANCGESVFAEMEKEATIMRELSHANIVNVIDFDRTKKKFRIVMEYVSGNSIDTVLKKYGPLAERTIATYTKQILSGLAYVHSKKVIHRDIKSKNILIDNKRVIKIADFGSAKQVMSDQTQGGSDPQLVASAQFGSTPLWTAPEILIGTYDAKVDIWSVGCVVIEMATAKYPWSECDFQNPFAALYQIGNTDALPQWPKSLSKPCQDFLLCSLVRDPTKRLSAQQCLKHDYVTDT